MERCFKTVFFRQETNHFLQQIKLEILLRTSLCGYVHKCVSQSYRTGEHDVFSVPEIENSDYCDTSFSFSVSYLRLVM